MSLPIPPPQSVRSAPRVAATDPNPYRPAPARVMRMLELAPDIRLNDLRFADTEHRQLDELAGPIAKPRCELGVDEPEIVAQGLHQEGHDRIAEGRADNLGAGLETQPRQNET